MTEHLNSDQLTRWSADVLLLYLAVDVGHLFHLQLAGQHHHVGKLGVELQGLDVRDVQLCAEVDFDGWGDGGTRYEITVCACTILVPPTILHDGNIAGNDGGDAGLAGGIHYLVHGLDVLAIDDGVHRQVGLYPRLIARSGNVAQVVNGEVVGRVRPHIQLFHTEIHGVSPRLQRRRQRVAATHWRHDFIVFHLLHRCKGSANRVKCKINYDLFSFPRCRLPSTVRSKVRLSEQKTKSFLGFLEREYPAVPNVNVCG